MDTKRVIHHHDVAVHIQTRRRNPIRSDTGAFHLLRPAGFRYVREVVAGNDAMLEFTAELDGIHINGIDMIHWNAAGRIDDFKVMIRPLKAVNLLHAKMAAMLESLGSKASASR